MIVSMISAKKIKRTAISQNCCLFARFTYLSVREIFANSFNHYLLESILSGKEKITCRKKYIAPTGNMAIIKTGVL